MKDIDSELNQGCSPELCLLIAISTEITVSGAGWKIIAPEHILLEMVKNQNSPVKKILIKAGLTIDAILTKLNEMYYPPLTKEDLELRDRQIDESIATGKEAPCSSNSEPPEFSDELTILLRYARREAKAIHYTCIGIRQLLLGMLCMKHDNISKIFDDLKIDRYALKNEVLSELDQSYLPPSPAQMQELLSSLEEEINENQTENSDDTDEPTPFDNEPVPVNSSNKSNGDDTFLHGKSPLHGKTILQNYGKDLTEMAMRNAFDPVIGRDREIQRITQILCRRMKNNAVLLGEAGVGKTAIVEGLAMNIVAGKVPQVLKNKHIFALDATLIVAGTQFRGQFEERMSKIIDEVKKSKKYILFLDEMHTIVGAGSGRDDGLDISNIMKPALSRGEIQCIGATTLKEYRKTIEKDNALERRFQSVLVQQPTPEEAEAILKGLIKGYEKYHNVKYSDEVLKAAVTLSVRYLPARSLPDKAIDIIDEAGSMVRLRESGKDEEKDKEAKTVDITLDDIRAVISEMAGVPLEKMKQEELSRMLEMENVLSQSVIGQTNAVASLSRSLKRSKAELSDPRRPIGSFLFVGPSGVGKSLLAKSLAEFMFHDKDALIRLDMSEYSEQYNISKMIGSAPGYVGYNEGGQLTEMVRRKPYSVILFDEIEKAHQQVANILLQILEDGQLTDNAGNTISFRNTIIIMTSNLGSEKGAGVHSLGFGEHTPEEDQKRINEATMNSVKQFFRPELLNRIDEIVFFRQLNGDDMKRIASLEISKLSERLKRIQGTLQVSDDLVNAILEKAKTAEGGARLVRRAVEELIEDRLAEELLKGEHPTPFTAVATKDTITIS